MEEAKKELAQFYPPDPDGSIPIGYIWARTIRCQNPLCGAEIPLFRQFWLAKKSNKKVALYPMVDREQKRVEFQIVGDGYDPFPEDFDPGKGTISKATAVCPVCGGIVEPTRTRELFRRGESGERLVAVVLQKPGQKGKFYRVATNRDREIFNRAAEYLAQKRKRLGREWGIDPVPDEPLPPKGTLGFRIQNYGFRKWGDLFNPRQQLALITFTEKIRQAFRLMLLEKYSPDYARAVVTYLGMVLDRLSTRNSNMCVWHTGSEQIEKVFAVQAFPMQFYYPESYPFLSSTATFKGNLQIVIKGLESIPNLRSVPRVIHSSVLHLPYPDNYFDGVFTDPPYYDNVPYSYLSDFFYVWLKRSIGYLYPKLFSFPITPKKEELVAYPKLDGGPEKAKEKFEQGLKKAFQEIHRVLKPNGVAIIVYAHKSTEGWETVINALLESGLVITASYPLNTEMQSRLRASNSAALASSIYIVARKLPRKKFGVYKKVRRELEEYLNHRLDLLWKEGIGGADFFIAAIGSAIEVFGKYQQVIDYSGQRITGKELLEDVRKIVIDYVIHQILHNGLAGEISPFTKFYLLYRYQYRDGVAPFDEVRKIAQSVGIDLEEWYQRGRRGIVQKIKGNIRVLGPDDRKDLEEIWERVDRGEEVELIDILHLVLKLWERGDREGMKEVLRRSGVGKGEGFYKVAQAISETLPIGSREKKLLDGFLTGRERLRAELERGLL